jgi:23S rRNA pseudouridine1911/1915/1917 synthase
VLRSGATLAWRKVHREPFAPTAVPVLFADADLLVVDKPAHLPMHADGPFVRSTLIHLLREQRQESDLGLVHRLDRETSGVCCLARTKAARRALQAAFAEGTVGKHYHAVVRGVVAAPFLCTQPIGRAPHSAIALRRAAGADAVAAQPARTEVIPEQVGAGVTLVRCVPHTGRTHQIRVHLEAAGHAIVGDKLYGRPDADYLAFVARVKNNGDARLVPPGECDRQLLHASELTLPHPATGERCTFRAPLPASFLSWLERGHG